jgi:hypothetical protein
MIDLPENTEMELAALADGSLTGERREEALARVRGSHELQTALEEQKRIVELTAAMDTRAPESLHRQVEAMLAPSMQRRGQSHPGSRLRRPRIGLATVAAVALIAIVVIALIGQPTHPGSSGLSVQQAAALTLSPATGPAPAENERQRSQLTVAVDGVSFPYWKERFGWRSSGTRSDEIGGRTVKTVFYTNSGGQRVGYAIASGRAPAIEGGKVVRRWGVSYRLLEHTGTTVITWQRGGHLCVMAGRGVSARTLLSLASWGSESSSTA